MHPTVRFLLLVSLPTLLTSCGGHGAFPNAISQSTSVTQAEPALTRQPAGLPVFVSLLKEFRPIGGSGNNLANPAFNAVPGSAELALVHHNFFDSAGFFSIPLNARTISNAISGGTGANGQNGQTTDPVRSAWLYVFGQFLDHDISLEQTPANSPPINIIIPPGDPVFPAGTVIPMTRDTRNPSTNTIITTNAGDLDLSQLYGSDTTNANSLANADGTLKTSNNGLDLPLVSGNFVTGDPRVMENPELTAVTTLFMREHNFWAKALKTQHADWTGSQLYNMAKAITTAEYQNIVYTEYLPALVGTMPMLGSYPGYNPSVNVQVTQEFSTAAFRVGHSQVSDTQKGVNNSGGIVFTESLAQSFFNTPQIDDANGLSPILRNLGQDFSQATDVYVVAALRNLLHAGLVGGDVDVMDLIAIDIQRERDAGLSTLNQTRWAIGMQPYTSFAGLTSDSKLQQNLQAVYGNINNVDLFMGGLAETPAGGASVGPTFRYIIADQFHRLMTGDRFFWKNQGFNQATASMISNTTLTTLMQRDSATTNGFQSNLFIPAPFPVI
jgi:peroxidase